MIMDRITSLKSREILDSRGNPTIEVALVLEGGATGIASVPSGASTGSYEAYELRDGESDRYCGLGVKKAVANVNMLISKEIVGNSYSQKSLDDLLIALDGTNNKSKLGANAILGVSLSFAKASASSLGVELFEHIGALSGNDRFAIPTPMFNVINGGKHADSGLVVQEFMLVPVGFDTFSSKVQAGAEIFSSLKNILRSRGLSIGVGDEGGFAPKLSDTDEALLLLENSIKDARYDFDQVKIGLDVAASSFFQDGIYRVTSKGGTVDLDNRGMVDWCSQLVEKHPIISLEDALSEDDYEGFSMLVDKLGDRVVVVGDDLTVTNTARINEAVSRRALNSLIIKPNQIGTLTETIEAIKLARSSCLEVIVSHRSGDTTDTFIADLAVGVSSKYFKSGSLSRGERTAKYNRLLEIEDRLNYKANTA